MKSFLQISLLVITLAAFSGAHAVLTPVEKAFKPEQSLDHARNLFVDAFNENAPIPEGLNMRLKRISALLRQYNPAYAALSNELDRIANLPTRDMIQALKHLQENSWHQLEPQGHF